MRRNLVLAILLTALIAFGVVTVAGGDNGPPVVPGTQAVLFIGNNWDGTADIVDPETFKTLDRFNVIPDLQERLNEIALDPERLGYFVAIRQLVGEGNDQYVDDMFSSHDGRFVYVSRPSLRDVVSIDLKTKQIVWRFVVAGQRSDHMAISPDGKVVLVSASTGNVVHALDTATGKQIGQWTSGDSPHENNYSIDGSKIFHASIGLVYTPADQPIADSSKGDRFFQIVDAKTYKVLKQYDIGKIMAEQGLGAYSSAVRPMAISPDEKTVYMQLSFLHGFVEFDLATEKVKRIANLPLAGDANGPRENYLLDSAHHGLAVSPDGKKLCAAGTMSDYAAIVSTENFEKFTVFPNISKPYWSTNSGDGKYCFVSASGADKVIVLDYASEKQVAEFAVGDHPQRMRMGLIRTEFLKTGVKPSAGPPRGVPNLQVLRARTRGGNLELKLRISSRAKGALRATFTAGGQRSSFSVKVPNRSTGTALWTVRRALTARQRAAATGVLELKFAGNTQVLADSTRVLTAAAGANLRTTRTSIDARGRLHAAGTIARAARGTVRARFAYVGEGTRVRYLRWSLPIKSGRFSLRELLPSQAARAGGHLTLEYAGDAARRLGGERIAERVRP